MTGAQGQNMASEELDAALKGAKLRSVAVFGGDGPRRVVVCRTSRGSAPVRLAVLDAQGRLLGTFPEASKCELLVPASLSLLGGRLALWVNAARNSPTVESLDISDLSVNKAFFRTEMPAQYMGLDVDAPRGKALVGYWEEDADFPLLAILDANGCSRLLDCEALIDSATEGFRWASEADKVRCHSNAMDRDVLLSLDLANNRIIWDPQALPGEPPLGLE